MYSTAEAGSPKLARGFGAKEIQHAKENVEVVSNDRIKLSMDSTDPQN